MANFISSYSIEDYFNGFIRKDENLNLEAFVSTLSLNEEKTEELKPLLTIDNSTDAKDGEYKFTEIVGLENIEWLSYEYIDCDFEGAQEQFEEIFCFEYNEV